MDKGETGKVNRWRKKVKIEREVDLNSLSKKRSELVKNAKKCVSLKTTKAPENLY